MGIPEMLHLPWKADDATPKKACWRVIPHVWILPDKAPQHDYHDLHKPRASVTAKLALIPGR